MGKDFERAAATKPKTPLKDAWGVKHLYYKGSGVQHCFRSAVKCSVPIEGTLYGIYEFK